jgi:hypothetical protein
VKKHLFEVVVQEYEDEKGNKEEEKRYSCSSLNLGMVLFFLSFLKFIFSNVLK